MNKQSPARLILVPASPKYAELFQRWRSQVSFVEHNPLKRLSMEECRKRLLAEGHSLKAGGNHESFRWFAKLEKKIIGSVSLNGINEMMKVAEVSYGVDEDFQGRGLGTIIVSMLVKKAFAETDLRKLIAYVHDKNIPSCRLLERIGFKKEGFLREHYLINGKPANEVVYGLLRAEA
ncbi:MAG TPA: GNAT family N-acetyltransferase [Elusimicrobia bacterium]|jgi:RimJ/RimL family protein N-acetyltransferase|nr:GNAT family N-acetyltransferase [Elusimicrobiota bacterium]